MTTILGRQNDQSQGHTQTCEFHQDIPTCHSYLSALNKKAFPSPWWLQQQYCISVVWDQTGNQSFTQGVWAGGGQREWNYHLECVGISRSDFESTFISGNSKNKPIFEERAFIARLRNIQTQWGCTSVIKEIRFLFFPARTNVYKCGAGQVSG